MLDGGGAPRGHSQGRWERREIRQELTSEEEHAEKQKNRGKAGCLARAVGRRSRRR